MNFKLSKPILFLAILFIGFGVIFSLAPAFSNVSEAQAATNLNGRILLAVQDKGQAWYVNPVNSRRYYLGRPDDAFQIMRSLGLGITNADFATWQKIAPRRLAGRILLKVQDKGQAYYVDPLDLKLYYLGRPTDSFNLMRSKGLGITNNDLARIPIFTSSSASATGSSSSLSSADPVPSASTTTVISRFTFKYQGNNYEFTQNLSESLYKAYKNSPKVYSYNSAEEPPNLREAFYGLFLKVKSGDVSLVDLAAKLKTIAGANDWNSDQLAEFALALIQYIPYDHAKLAIDGNRNTNPYYPYETLYLDKGVCSDKTFLAVALLRQLGYGAAILDFPERNHTAVGIACPAEYSLNGSGYCYAETTNYFPLGVIPESISSGQAQTPDNDLVGLFDSAGLGKMEIYQETSGQVYRGVTATRAKVEALRTSKDELNARQTDIDELENDSRTRENNLSAMKTQMDTYYNSGQIVEYNDLVPTYNNLVSQYNAVLANYRTKVNEYNQQAAEFNAAMKAFYQQ
ncbi:MAG: transglutaminase-like domain-containing protein [Patescibacteria group bacterium]